MEINAANVAQHKIFHVKPSFVDKKKMDEKGRFGELSTQEIQELWINEVWITVNSVQLLFASLLIFHSTVHTVVHLSCDHEIISFWRPEVTSLSGHFFDFNKI